MSTLKNKVSLQIDSQLPEFVQAENPDFISFMKTYYEFLESAELKLTTLGNVDAILSESQPVDASSDNFIILEDTNRYRPDESNKIHLQNYDQFWTEGTAQATPGAPVPYPPDGVTVSPPGTTDILLDTVLIRTVGAFVNGETITGTTSKATAVIRVEDINNNSRLFISSQNNFLINETVTGGTSNASGVISDYTANPVQNIQQLLEYADIDDTIDQFFDQFKEAFLKTIPKDLTAGVNERTLLKNIKDLYRSKGTKKGHELFFRILLNEEVLLSYPTLDMLRVSDGDWSEDTILRVTPGDDTILMEDASDANGDIFILLEDGAQLQTEISLPGTSDLLKLVSQEITQRAVIDLSILAGGAYYGEGFSVISEATALVDKVISYTIGAETVYELVLSTGSVVGTFVSGQTVTAEANDDPDVTLYGKLTSIVTGYNSQLSTSSQYYDIDDPLTVTADNGAEAAAKIESLTSGTISEIIVDSGGSGYEIDDAVSVNNANTNGTALAAQISLVNGGISPEAGTVLGQVNVGGEFGVIVYENGSDSNTGIVYNERIGQEWGTIYDQSPPSTPWPPAASDIILEDGFNFLAEDDVGFNSIITGASKLSTDWSLREHIILETYDSQISAVGHIDVENYTVINDGIPGQKVAQESGTGNGDVTDIVVTAEGWGYTKTPLLTLPTTDSRTGATIYAKGTAVGSIRDVSIINAGVHYTSPITLSSLTNFLCTDISGTFTLDETVTGGTSGATGVYKETDADRNVIKLSNIVGTFLAGTDKSGETITGADSTVTAIIDSYDPVALIANQGTVGETSGKFLNEDGFLDEKTKKIQDSYYWQDYSYVVKTASSINNWRDQLIASVHPAGWLVFGQVDIATAVQSIANITSIFGLGGLYKYIWNVLIGRRLGTIDQGTLSTSPAVGIADPSTPTPALAVTGSGTFTNGQVITGGTSGATGLVFSDTTPAAERLIHFTSLTGIFLVAETISAGAVTATVVEVYGLLGQRDLTLTHHMEILKPPIYMVGDKYGFHPNLGDGNEWKFSNGMVSSASSSRTFSSMAVYPVYLNMITTISSGLDSSTTTIPVTATDNLPTQGTIKLESEEITYTGRSTASGVGNLTGATRGTNGTSAASHVINTNLTLVRLAATQSTASGFRISDWATDWRGVALTIGDIGTYPQRKNYISAPTEITMWKT